MHIKFLKVNWELRTWILWRIVRISRNWTNFIKKIYTYNLRSFLFVSLHTAQAQCTLYTVIILYTVLEHILLRCTTLNSKIYMTTMNNESYCCVLIPLPWKKFDEAPLKIIDEKIKCNMKHTVLVHSSDGELWCFLCLGITADPMMDPRIFIHKLFSKLWMLM